MCPNLHQLRMISSKLLFNHLNHHHTHHHCTIPASRSFATTRKCYPIDPLFTDSTNTKTRTTSELLSLSTHMMCGQALQVLLSVILSLQYQISIREILIPFLVMTDSTLRLFITFPSPFKLKVMITLMLLNVTSKPSMKSWIH